MDSESAGKRSNPNPKLYANFLNRLVFGWLHPFFHRARYHEPQEKDLYNVLPEDSSKSVGARLESFWNRELSTSTDRKKKPKLARAIARFSSCSHLKYGACLFLLNVFVRVAEPLILGKLLLYFYPNATTTTSEAYLYASSLLSLIILRIILDRHANYGLSVIGMRLRIACSSLVYKKVTRLSVTGLRRMRDQRIIDPLSKDIERLENVFVSLHNAWTIPLQAIVTICFMWRYIGTCALVGVSLMILLSDPVQILLEELMSKLRVRASTWTGARKLMVGELMAGIRSVKLQVWEKAFESLLSPIRREETKIIQTYSFLKGISFACIMFTDLTTLFFTLLLYALQGFAIKASTAYAIAYYYYHLRETLICQLPSAVKNLIDANRSVERIQKLLLLEEVEKPAEILPNAEKIISIENVSSRWSEKSIAHTLRDVSLSVWRGKLHCVVGPSGAGKSSLLELILGEAKPSRGRVRISGRISYGGREARLVDGSIERNVLLDEPYDEERYRRVVHACALEDDLEALDLPDEALVRRRELPALDGLQLSKIALARAIYKDADVYLLDDPLSGFDRESGKKINNDCVVEFLRDKTRILVTNEVEYLKEADIVIFLENGAIKFEGTYEEFRGNDQLFQRLPFARGENYEAGIEGDNEPSDDESTFGPNDERDGKEERTESEELLLDDGRSRSAYWWYFQSSDSYFPIVATIVSFAFAQALLSASVYWIASWTEGKDEMLRALAVGESTPAWIPGALMISSLLMFALANGLLSLVFSLINTQLHDVMFANLLRLPMRYFESNSSGQMSNRFFRDMRVADETIPLATSRAVAQLSVVVATIALVLSVNCFAILPFLGTLYLYSRAERMYSRTARKIEKLEYAAKERVRAHARSSATGFLGIRVQGTEAPLLRDFHQLLDGHTSAHFLRVASSQAFDFWTDVFYSLFTITICYSFVVLSNSMNFSPGYVGAIVCQVVALASSSRMFLRSFDDVVSRKTTLDRIFRIDESEDRRDDLSGNVSESWPDRGDIKFEGVTVRDSRSGLPMLQDLNFTVRSGEKIAIVGLDDKCKTCLASAILGLSEIEGSVYVDDIDTRVIPLDQLRRGISVIPQHPILLSSSLRRNLDPQDRFDDYLLWSALEAVELKSLTRSLDAELRESESDAGLRQLLSLARALLRNSRILIYEESGDVDTSTADLIERVIIDRFKDCTVIAVAHRSILGSDGVITVERGRFAARDG